MGTTNLTRHHFVRLLTAALMSVTIILPQAVIPAAAASERALYLYYTHTKETARIVFKRNGQYVQQGLKDLNYSCVTGAATSPPPWTRACSI